MNVLAKIRSRFTPAIDELSDIESGPLLEMIKPAQDSHFGDYQVNSAMSLKKRLKSKYENLSSPREVASKILELVDVKDFCTKTEIAGPGFINLTLDDDWIKQNLAKALVDDRLGVEPTSEPVTVVIDYSSPNVAKPMHVGHIRSTVIGDALAKILRFAGNRVITDNHLGDWGTQFGMIIYGYKNFADPQAYRDNPIEELLRLYRLVRQITDFHQFKNQSIPKLQQEQLDLQTKLEQLEAADKPADKSAAKKQRKEIGRLNEKIKEIMTTLQGDEKSTGMLETVAYVERDSAKLNLFNEHADIGDQVLEETAKLHSGDEENLKLWHEFLPSCRQDIQKIYNRLDIEFDYEHGESFYQDQLSGVVESLQEKKLASESQGATCVFLDQYETPMIVQKKDGAFLYATSDLATIQYRMKTWQPDVSLYVVDHRQHEHFAKLFAVAEKWGYDQIDLRHISFGTILGPDGKPYKTRDGDTVGLEGLLNEAVSRALAVVTELDEKNPDGPQLDQSQRAEIAEVVGIGALKYADLSQNRTSDYKFDYDKMINLKGNTATYLQYCFARVQGIFRKGGIDPESIRQTAQPFIFEKNIERVLALKICQFGEAIDEVLVDYKPNLLSQYLFELANIYNSFFEECHVLKSEGELKASRLQLCDLVARTIRQGLSLLGIGVVDRM